MKQAIAALGCLVFAAFHVQAFDAQTLAVDRVIAREGRTGDVHHYTVELRANDFLELRVAQRDAAVGLTILGEDGAPLRRFAPLELAPLDAPVLFVAPETGVYGLRLRVGEHAAPVGRYTLRVVALRAALDADRVRDRCFAMVVEADRLAHIQSMESLAASFDRMGEAAACWRAAGDTTLEIAALHPLATLTAMFAQFSTRSAEAYERLAVLYRAAADVEHELVSLASVVREYQNGGRFDRARDTAALMRAVAVRAGDPQREREAIGRVGLAELMLGNYASARAAASEGLELGVAANDARGQAVAELTLAQLEELAGDDRAARARYDRVLQMSPDSHSTSMVLIQLGFLHLRRGQYELAAARFSQRLAAMPHNVQREEEALARLGLGDVQLARGDRAGARTLYDEANAALARGNTRHRCTGLDRLGKLALLENVLERARESFAEMLTLAHRTGFPPCESQGRSGLATVAARRGEWASADEEARRVVEIVETFREAVPSLESRSLGFGALAPAFEQAIDIAMRRAAAEGDLGATARAFEFNERALARGLLDRIAAAALDDRADVPAPLREERQAVRDRRRAALAEWQVISSDGGSREAVEAVRARVAALEVQLHNLDARVDAVNTRRVDVIAPKPLDVPGVQALLDDETQLIEYALGEQQSYAWVVSSTGLRGVPLARRSAIEAAVRLVRSDLTWGADGLQPIARAHRRALAELVLAPLGPLLHARRLVIVATGALSLVPFGALPAPQAVPRASMISRFEIVHAPSASTLAALRQLSHDRPAASRAAIVLADPIFDSGDPRVRKQGDPEPARDRAAETAARLGKTFRRLPYSRDEAEAIAAMLPGQVTLLKDGQATRDRVLDRGLSDYRIVHFGTHGIVHPEITSLSSIVMSLIDRHGLARDPFLTLSDIHDMRLNADVVVLSACNTALGKDVPGEGPIGIARAFMYAGAHRVVASLWEVNDRATAELMKRFYRGLLLNGLSAAAALRAAQQEMAATPQWRSPYYWAGFVIQGDWRPFQPARDEAAALTVPVRGSVR